MSGFSSADEYAQNAVQEYKLNYIDPVSSSIDEQFSRLGIDGAGWASDASEEIISSLSKRGDVKTFNTPFQPFNSGKSHITNHKELLYLCKITNM